MTDILDEARAMLEGVTEGPWDSDYGVIPPDGPGRYSEVYARCVDDDGTEDLIIIAGTNELLSTAPDQGRANRDFITWSRTGVPALIERVAALEGALKQGAAWFREYETEHRKKAERGPNVAEAEARFDKADRNRDRAEYLERAILAKGAAMQSDVIPGAALCVAVEKIETVTIDSLMQEPGEPIWRIEIDGFCIDFDFEQAANNVAGAINARFESLSRQISDLRAAVSATRKGLADAFRTAQEADDIESIEGLRMAVSMFGRAFPEHTEGGKP